jgi:hypothetical protein
VIRRTTRTLLTHPSAKFCQDYRCGSSDIDELIVVLIGRMMILCNSEWTIFKITALSAPYSVKFNFITRDKVPLYAKGPHAKW